MKNQLNILKYNFISDFFEQHFKILVQKMRNFPAAFFP